MKGPHITAFSDGVFAPWKERFDCLAATKEWKDATKAAHLPLYLEGDAFEVHRNLTEEIRNSYEKTTEELLRIFSRGRPEALKEFELLKLEAGKNAVIFLSKVRSRCRECYPNMTDSEREILVRDQFLKGLPQCYLPHIVSNQQLKNCEDIAKVIEDLKAIGGIPQVCNSMSSQRKEQEEYFQSPTGKGNALTEVEKLREEMREMKVCVMQMMKQKEREMAQSTRTMYNKVKCYQCGMFGHIARHCNREAENFREAPSRGVGRLSSKQPHWRQ
jgi:hypothetical protein